MRNSVPGGLLPEFIRVVLVPREGFENTVFYQFEWMPFDPEKIATEGVGFTALWVVAQRELIGENFLTESLFGEERIPSFHQTAVKSDITGEVEHVGDRRGTEHDVITTERKLLRCIMRVAINQGSQLSAQGDCIQIAFLLGGLF